MKNILIVSANGLSTSLLVANINKEVSKRNLEWSVEQISDYQKFEKWDLLDVCLLAPQKRNQYTEIKKKLSNVEIIDMRAYASGDGMLVLEQALKLI